MTQSKDQQFPRTVPDEGLGAVPRLICYPLEPDPPAIEPGRSGRDWMDDTDQRFAYRCLPLSIANASGWEILSPASFAATWTGGAAPSAMSVRGLDDRERAGRLASSHFGHGVLTFHTGYLFRTSPGWALWARGSPNSAKRNLVPLDGLVETEWLDFPFTMNWRFTRPGTVQFDRGEAFCFLTLVPHALLDQVEPEIRPLDENPDLKAAFEERSKNRAEFNGKLAARDPEVVAQGWQRHYVRGEEASGRTAGFHISKRRLKPARPR